MEEDYAFESCIPSVCHKQWLLKELSKLTDENILTEEQGNYLITWEGNVYDDCDVEGEPRDEPDVGIRPAGADFPSLIILSGIWKDQGRVREEMTEWIMEGEGAVQKAVILLWRMEDQKLIDFVVEVYKYDEKVEDTVKKIRESKITPSGQHEHVDSVEIDVTISELFAQHIPFYNVAPEKRLVMSTAPLVKLSVECTAEEAKEREQAMALQAAAKEKYRVEKQMKKLEDMRRKEVKEEAVKGECHQRGRKQQELICKKKAAEESAEQKRCEEARRRKQAIEARKAEEEVASLAELSREARDLVRKEQERAFRRHAEDCRRAEATFIPATRPQGSRLVDQSRNGMSYPGTGDHGNSPFNPVSSGRSSGGAEFISDDVSNNDHNTDIKEDENLNEKKDGTTIPVQVPARHDAVLLPDPKTLDKLSESPSKIYSGIPSGESSSKHSKEQDETQGQDSFSRLFGGKKEPPPNIDDPLKAATPLVNSDRFSDSHFCGTDAPGESFSNAGPLVSSDTSLYSNASTGLDYNFTPPTEVVPKVYGGLAMVKPSTSSLGQPAFFFKSSNIKNISSNTHHGSSTLQSEPGSAALSGPSTLENPESKEGSERFLEAIQKQYDDDITGSRTDIENTTHGKVASSINVGIMPKSTKNRETQCEIAEDLVSKTNPTDTTTTTDDSKGNPLVRSLDNRQPEATAFRSLTTPNLDTAQKPITDNPASANPLSTVSGDSGHVSEISSSHFTSALDDTTDNDLATDDSGYSENEAPDITTGTKLFLTDQTNYSSPMVDVHTDSSEAAVPDFENTDSIKHATTSENVKTNGNSESPPNSAIAIHTLPSPVEASKTVRYPFEDYVAGNKDSAEAKNFEPDAPPFVIPIAENTGTSEFATSDSDVGVKPDFVGLKDPADNIESSTLSGNMYETKNQELEGPGSAKAMIQKDLESGDDIDALSHFDITENTVSKVLKAAAQILQGTAVEDYETDPKNTHKDVTPDDISSLKYIGFSSGLRSVKDVQDNFATIKNTSDPPYPIDTSVDTSNVNKADGLDSKVPPHETNENCFEDSTGEGQDTLVTSQELNISSANLATAPPKSPGDVSKFATGSLVLSTNQKIHSQDSINDSGLRISDRTQGISPATSNADLSNGFNILQDLEPVHPPMSQIDNYQPMDDGKPDSSRHDPSSQPAVKEPPSPQSSKAARVTAPPITGDSIKKIFITVSETVLDWEIINSFSTQEIKPGHVANYFVTKPVRDSAVSAEKALTSLNDEHLKHDEELETVLGASLPTYSSQEEPSLNKDHENSVNPVKKPECSQSYSSIQNDTKDTSAVATSIPDRITSPTDDNSAEAANIAQKSLARETAKTDVQMWSKSPKVDPINVDTDSNKSSVVIGGISSSVNDDFEKDPLLPQSNIAAQVSDATSLLENIVDVPDITDATSTIHEESLSDKEREDPEKQSLPKHFLKTPSESTPFQDESRVATYLPEIIYTNDSASQAPVTDDSPSGVSPDGEFQELKFPSNSRSSDNKKPPKFSSSKPETGSSSEVATEIPKFSPGVSESAPSTENSDSYPETTTIMKDDFNTENQKVAEGSLYVFDTADGDAVEKDVRVICDDFATTVTRSDNGPADVPAHEAVFANGLDISSSAVKMENNHTLEMDVSRLIDSLPKSMTHSGEDTANVTTHKPGANASINSSSRERDYQFPSSTSDISRLSPTKSANGVKSASGTGQYCRNSGPRSREEVLDEAAEVITSEDYITIGIVFNKSKGVDFQSGKIVEKTDLVESLALQISQNPSQKPADHAHSIAPRDPFSEAWESLRGSGYVSPFKFAEEFSAHSLVNVNPTSSTCESHLPVDVTSEKRHVRVSLDVDTSPTTSNWPLTRIWRQPSAAWMKWSASTSAQSRESLLKPSPTEETGGVGNIRADNSLGFTGGVGNLTIKSPQLDGLSWRRRSVISAKSPLAMDTSLPSNSQKKEADAPLFTSTALFNSMAQTPKTPIRVATIGRSTEFGDLSGYSSSSPASSVISSSEQKEPLSFKTSSWTSIPSAAALSVNNKPTPLPAKPSKGLAALQDLTPTFNYRSSSSASSSLWSWNMSQSSLSFANRKDSDSEASYILGQPSGSILPAPLISTGLPKLSEELTTLNIETTNIDLTPPHSPDDTKFMMENVVDITEEAYSDASPCMECGQSLDTINLEFPKSTELMGAYDVPGFTMSVAVEDTSQGVSSAKIEEQKNMVRSGFIKFVEKINMANLIGSWGGSGEVLKVPRPFSSVTANSSKGPEHAKRCDDIPAVLAKIEQRLRSRASENVIKHHVTFVEEEEEEGGEGEEVELEDHEDKYEEFVEVHVVKRKVAQYAAV